MTEAHALIQAACRAMAAGDIGACQQELEHFRSRVAGRPLAPQSRAECERELERLRALALAANEGLDDARDWLRELSAVLGGLDIYDRDGRQRVSTGLTGPTRRF